MKYANTARITLYYAVLSTQPPPFAQVVEMVLWWG